jgi:hypothetical protein
MRTLTRPGAWLHSAKRHIARPKLQNQLKGERIPAPWNDLDVPRFELLEPRVLMHGGLVTDPDTGLSRWAEPYEALSADLDHACDGAHAEHSDCEGSEWVAAMGGSGSTEGPYLRAPDSGGYYTWKDQITSTPGVIDLYYDFRSENGYANLITAAQRAAAQAALDMWEAATGGKLNFIRNTTASAGRIINIGLGSLAAVGHGGSNYLGVSLNSISPYEHSISWSTVWMNKNYTWDTVVGNGDSSGAYDFFTSVAHEVGHSLGLGHMDSFTGSDIMDGQYPGEMTRPSSNDLKYIRNLYGYGGTSSTSTGGTSGSTSGTSTSTTSSGFIVKPASGLVTTESGGTASFGVSLTTQPTHHVTITLGSSDSSEGVASRTSLTFTPSNWSSAQYVTVRGANDSVRDGDVAYRIILRRASSMDKRYDDKDPTDVSVVNRDDDGAAQAASTGPAVRVSPTTGLYTSEWGGTATFSVVLSTQPTHNVTFTLATSDTSEGRPSRDRLTFTASNWNTPQYVTVRGVDDGLRDGNVDYKIVLRKVSSTDKRYDNFDPADVTVINRDNEAATQLAQSPTGLASSMGAAALLESSDPRSAQRLRRLDSPAFIVDLLGELLEQAKPS